MMIKFVKNDHTTVIPPTDISETPHRESRKYSITNQIKSVVGVLP